MGFDEELLAVLAGQQESFTGFIISSRGMALPPGGVSYPPAELRQMVTGFWALVREGIGGNSREVRDLYLSSVFPGLRDTGTPVHQMLSGSARVLFHVLVEMVSRVSAE